MEKLRSGYIGYLHIAITLIVNDCIGLQRRAAKADDWSEADRYDFPVATRRPNPPHSQGLGKRRAGNVGPARQLTDVM